MRWATNARELGKSEEATTYARERLITRNPDYLRLDDVIGQFAVDLASKPRSTRSRRS